MMNILVTGSNGQLGSEIRELAKEYSQYHFTFTDIDELDLTNYKNLEDFLDQNSFTFCIHCAAYTAVDKAEDEREKAYEINGQTAGHLANLCRKHDIFLIFLSTDYVFNGKNYKPYIETDKTAPRTVYGKSKLDGELAVASSGARYVIIRTSWLYSAYGHNFVKTMLRMGSERDIVHVVSDQTGTPTYAADLAGMILEIIPLLNKEHAGEIYHYSNEGLASWFDFAKAIMSLSKTVCKVLPIETRDFPSRAKRPYYSVLNKRKIREAFDIEIPHWRDSLEKAIQRMTT
ncbi:MAG: dTDP-4-dehydrorhamnose reductase [bacterium]|jgi:dTDP-4-dehydrorhamnose reductase